MGRREKEKEKADIYAFPVPQLELWLEVSWKVFFFGNIGLADKPCGGLLIRSSASIFAGIGLVRYSFHCVRV